MRAYAEIVVLAPHRDFGADAAVVSARKAAAAPLDVGEDAVAALGAQGIQALFEQAFVVHRRYRYQTGAPVRRRHY